MLNQCGDCGRNDPILFGKHTWEWVKDWSPGQACGLIFAALLIS